jgi:riboflavin transporter FmnP
MEESKELSELTDQEVLAEAKKMKSTSVINAFLIGLMIGIIFYGVVKNSLGFFTLIPLFFAFKVFHNPKNNEYNEVLKKELKARKLK